MCDFLDITPDIIQRAQRCNTYNCPIALAFKQQYPQYMCVTVLNNGIYYTKRDGSNGHHYLSNELYKQMKSFDEGGVFQPGTYAIDSQRTPDDMPVNAGKTTE